MSNSQPSPKPSNDIVSQVAERVRTSDNVLVALSKDPSVDELSAALGLTFILDKLGKHATAIFSGAVPNAIEFLEPEKTFETNTNSLQDFIIALDKEKADHLRYKIDGDYVKVFITPYKTTIDEKDMEFSHGDYNVDLVIALNVANSSDLDAALAEYGRIMHDASSINISAAAPGHFGDLEWGDPGSSSVSEMVCELANRIKDKDKDVFDKPIATALLAGIVAATNRFSNERTSASTMSIASQLMSAGADQQLISSSIPVDILTSATVDAADDDASDKEEEHGDKKASDDTPAKEDEKPADPTTLEIHHGAVDYDPEEGIKEEPKEEEPKEESREDADKTAEAALDEIVAKPSALSDGLLMDELRNQSASVAAASKRTLTPSADALQPPAAPKDYASLMNAELQAAPIEPPAAVASAPSPETSEIPTEPAPVVTVPQAPQATATPAAPAAEYVAPLPMPSTETILPPPPSPFSPTTAPAAPELAPEPSAAVFAENLIADATVSTPTTPATPPADAATPVDGLAATPVVAPPADLATIQSPQAPQASAPTEAPVATTTLPPVATAPAQDTQAPQVPQGELNSSPVIPEQVYPPDPGAFRIPGM